VALGIHILRIYIDCVDFADVRQTFYNVNSLFNLFTNVAGDTILEFLPSVLGYNAHIRLFSFSLTILEFLSDIHYRQYHLIPHIISASRE